MKKILLIYVVSCFCVGIAQGQSKIYSTTGGELIFSSASATQGGVNLNTITRFSPVFNFQNIVHIDMGEKVGLMTGVSVRNVGLIWDDPTAPATRYKARAYTLGIPLGLKIGKMNGLHLFGGYEIEFPFHFKKKTFVNDVKTKASDWFSSQVPGLYQSFFVGIQLPEGLQIKYKYYMTGFFNKGYAANDGNGNVVYPYQNLDANVYYISLSYQILKGSKIYYNK